MLDHADAGVKRHRVFQRELRLRLVFKYVGSDLGAQSHWASDRRPPPEGVHGDPQADPEEDPGRRDARQAPLQEVRLVWTAGGFCSSELSPASAGPPTRFQPGLHGELGGFLLK